MIKRVYVAAKAMFINNKMKNTADVVIKEKLGIL